MYTRSETLIGKTIGKYKILGIIGKSKAERHYLVHNV